MGTHQDKRRLRFYLVLLVSVVLLGTFGFMLVEGKSLADGLYFTIVTIATVGYGDIAPTTVAGKILAMFLIVTGVGTFLGVIANATEIFLNRREADVRLQKLHMVVGIFFSETGNRMLKIFAAADPDINNIGKLAAFGESWSTVDFTKAAQAVRQSHPDIDPARIDFVELRDFLNEQRDLIVRLLESPYMLEHEVFTDLLLATLHLKEELLHREQFDGLPQTDLDHLRGDMRRVYPLLLGQWLEYLAHLKEHYPYLYSLAHRTNPFNANASAIVR